MLKESYVFNNSKRETTPKFTMPDMFEGTENPLHCVKNFVSAMTLKGIDRDILHLIFL